MTAEGSSSASALLLARMETALAAADGESCVPCDGCIACCRSWMDIYIAPDETRTLTRIPPELLRPAPGLPEGNMVLGPDGAGHCPLLTERGCSIYGDRPRVCRRYDCRMYAITGVAVDPRQPEIAQRVGAWGIAADTKLARVAALLLSRRDLFPPGVLPDQPGQIAVLAVRTYRFLSGEPDEAFVAEVCRVSRQIAYHASNT